MEERIVAYDTETTGLKPSKGHRPLTAAFILTSDQLGELDSIEIKIWSDDFVIDQKALEINKIDIEAHKREALSPLAAVDRIKAFLSNADSPVLLGHNEHFDRGMMEALFADVGEDFSKFVHYRRLDTCAMYRILKDAGRLPILASRRTPDAYKNAKLDTAVAAYGIKFNPEMRHTALLDAQLTLAIYRKMSTSLRPWWRVVLGMFGKR